jgi:hypothetical protein
MIKKITLLLCILLFTQFLMAQDATRTREKMKLVGKKSTSEAGL